VTEGNIQCHEASRGLSATAMLHVRRREWCDAIYLYWCHIGWRLFYSTRDDICI